MALDYDLHMATALEPTQTLCLMLNKFSLKWNIDNNWLVGAGVIVGAIKSTELNQSILEEEFCGFRPTVSVWFEIDKFNYEEGMNTLRQATMEVLRQVPGDAVLLFNGETIVLQRLGGRLILNEGWEDWNADLLAKVTLPYELRQIP